MRGSDLDDRTFPAHRSAAADRQRGRQGFDGGDLWWDPSSTPRDGEHHLRYAVAAGFSGEVVHQRSVQQPGDHWGHQHEPPTQGRKLRITHRSQAGVVGMSGEQQGERLDQPAEDDRATACSGSHDDCQRQQSGVGRAESRQSTLTTEPDRHHQRAGQAAGHCGPLIR